MTDTLKLEGVGLDVRDGSSLRTLLEIDEFCLEPGEMIAVRGASGAGKTTFLKLVSGILLPTRGRVLYGDTEAEQWFTLLPSASTLQLRVYVEPQQPEGFETNPRRCRRLPVLNSLVCIPRRYA